MAARKFRANLKRIVKPIDTLDTRIRKAIKRNRIAEKDVKSLREALEKAREIVAAECCDNRFFCDF